MATWHLERGPWDGETRVAFPGRELLIPVETKDRRLLTVVYTAMRGHDETIYARYEGYREHAD